MSAPSSEVRKRYAASPRGKANRIRYYNSPKGKLIWLKSNIKVKSGNSINLTLEQYNSLVQEQNNLCAICGKPEAALHHRTKAPRALALDHNHITGKVRGLLCVKCNTGIGYLNGDLGVEILLSAIKYLQERDNNE